MTEGNLHGPYYQWTRKISGKTVNINLDIDSAKKVKEWIQNNRSLRKLCRRLGKGSNYNISLCCASLRLFHEKECKVMV